MALERVLTVKEQFYNLQFVRNVRRDPELGEQLYLVDRSGRGGKMCYSFLQALGDGNRIGCFTFLKHKFNEDERLVPDCAIDERQKLLYISKSYCGSDLKQVIYLKLFHLKFKAADKFGYRRVRAQNGPCVNVEGMPDPGQRTLISLFPVVQTLTVVPSTGQLVTAYVTEGLDGTNPLRMAVFPADIIYSCDTQKATLNSVTDRLRFMTHLEVMLMELHHPIFSRSNHLLFWQGFTLNPSDLAVETAKFTPEDGFVSLMWYDPGHAGKGDRSTIKIDPVALVRSLLPESLFDNFMASVPPSTLSARYHFGSHLRLLGHVHKYGVFAFKLNCIMAVKWPREWYKLSQLPEVRVSKVINIDKETKGELNDACLMGTDLYVKCAPGHKQEVVRRLALSEKFKDYRICASCGKQEKGKTRNKDGKRMSTFKVCRICKQLNFNLFYSDATLACHYCSQKCVRKDWKMHKNIHKKSAKDRKI